jgi:hypothetical protein
VYGYEYILEDLFSVLGVSGQSRSETENLVTVSRDELLEALLISLLELYD